MNPRIASIENLIASDPAGRNIFGLTVTDELRLAAQSLALARRVVIISGFYIPSANASETDGPPGAAAIGRALDSMEIEVEYLTDTWNATAFRALDVQPTVAGAETVEARQSRSANDFAQNHGHRCYHSGAESSSLRFDAPNGSFTPGVDQWLDNVMPTHIVSVERVGRGVDGQFRNMRGDDISETTAPLDEVVIAAGRRGITTIGIGDGGNEIGMGRVFGETLISIPNGRRIACVVPTDYCIVCGVSNWGAYGLVGALSVLAQRDLLPTSVRAVADVHRMVANGGAVDGMTRLREVTVDSVPMSASVKMIEGIRNHVMPSPLLSGRKLTVGVLGYGITGRSAASLLADRGHDVLVSDVNPAVFESGASPYTIEAGRHSIEFLSSCDLIIASPGVSRDEPILDALHARGIPVMSELEAAGQLCEQPIVAITGTIGKRTTVELLERMFRSFGIQLRIGGNRGAPLSALLSEGSPTNADKRSPWIALSVSSFQLESAVHFRPEIAIILNIDEQHLDRHKSIAEYVRIKSRIFMNHMPHDSLILNADDARVRALARKHHGRTTFVSAVGPVDQGAWMENGRVVLHMDGIEECVDVGQVDWPISVLSAIVACKLMGLDLSSTGREWIR